MTLTPRSPRRGGFTLVELMVAAAISVIIMAVLATAFQMGIDTMRQMRSAADMANQLRATQDVIRRDLQGDCFVPEDGKPNSGLKVSNHQFNKNGGTTVVNPPTGGFMFISSAATMSEGSDADGMTSTIANPGIQNGVSHVLQFTSVLQNNSEQNVFTAVSPAGNSGRTFTSRAAEVTYFLGPMNPQAFTSGLGGGLPLAQGGGTQIPLFNLFRRQRLVAYNSDDVVALSAALAIDPNAGDVIATRILPGPPPTTVVNTMQDETTNRLSPAPFPPGSPRFGEDVLLSNVISFEVKVNWVPGGTAAGPRGFGTVGVPGGTVDQETTTAFKTSSDFPFDNLAKFPNSQFDSNNPPSIRVMAIQIRIRVFDPKLNNARQLTIIQNL